jgi:PAS domain S-box-containing protein
VHAPVAIAWLSLDGTIAEANEAFAALTGADADQLPGRLLADLVEDATDIEELLAGIQQGRPGSRTIRWISRDHSTRRLHCDVSPVKQAGRLAGSRWFVREEAAAHRASDSRSAAANVPAMVHRLRNSLAPISSSLDVLELDGVDPASLRELRDQLARLESEIAHLLVSAPPAQHQLTEQSERPGSGNSSNRSSGVQTAPRILIVDDNPAIHRALQLLVRTLGYSDVQTASTGEAALSRFTDWRPSLVFLDIGLPDLDGFAVARRIRALPGGEDAVLVALSGYGQPDDRRDALAAGFDQYLVKPCRLDDLNGVLRHPRLSPALAAVQERPVISVRPQTTQESGSGGAAGRESEPLAARIGSLLREFVHDARTAAFPLQIQQHLLEKSGQPVSADDTAIVLREYLAHCETLLGVLRRAGLLLRDEFDPHFGNVPVQDAIDRAMDEGNRRFADRSIRIAAQGSLNGVLVRADRELIVQALVELLDNAGHASPDGASVTIEAAERGECVVISVCDSGSGMPGGEAAERPFERFGGKPAPLHGKIGVGLAIARRIAEIHGGQLSLSHRQPQGCRATLELPAQHQAH